MLAGACTPAVAPAVVTASTRTAPAHAPEIRFGLIGEVTYSNVWALFSGRDYSYNNYAVRAHYWPRLYGLSVPGQAFEPITAGGPPGPIRQEGAFYAATVPVRTDLRWTDGAAFAAEDVAFTSTPRSALSWFRLGRLLRSSLARSRRSRVT